MKCGGGVDQAGMNWRLQEVLVAVEAIDAVAALVRSEKAVFTSSRSG